MDPFSSEGELLAIHNAFHQGAYSTVLEQSLAGLSPANALTAKVYVLRTRIAVGQAAEVSSELGGASEPDLIAVKAFADYTAGDKQGAVKVAEELATSSTDNTTVQVLAATVLHLEGRSEEALGLLSKHQGSLEAVALIVQIRLSQNRTDLAQKEVQTAKKWAQDSLLVNLAESWVGLRMGGEKYQQAYYVYEELASVPSSSTSRTLLGQAIAELHMGRTEEAEVALQQALEKDATNPDVLVNCIVNSLLSGKDYSEYASTLQSTAPEHPFLVNATQKSDLFDSAAAKYSARINA